MSNAVLAMPLAELEACLAQGRRSNRIESKKRASLFERTDTLLS